VDDGPSAAALSALTALQRAVQQGSGLPSTAAANVDTTELDLPSPSASLNQRSAALALAEMHQRAGGVRPLSATLSQAQPSAGANGRRALPRGGRRALPRGGKGGQGGGGGGGGGETARGDNGSAPASPRLGPQAGPTPQLHQAEAFQAMLQRIMATSSAVAAAAPGVSISSAPVAGGPVYAGAQAFHASELGQMLARAQAQAAAQSSIPSSGAAAALVQQALQQVMAYSPGQPPLSLGRPPQRLGAPGTHAAAMHAPSAAPQQLDVLRHILAAQASSAAVHPSLTSPLARGAGDSSESTASRSGLARVSNGIPMTTMSPQDWMANLFAAAPGSMAAAAPSSPGLRASAISQQPSLAGRSRRSTSSSKRPPSGKGGASVASPSSAASPAVVRS
jgi:hypothetical protein